MSAVAVIGSGLMGRGIAFAAAGGFETTLHDVSADALERAFGQIRRDLNHPMGPFEMVDLVGLDTRLAALQTLHRHLGEKHEPAALLERYVREGRPGKKAGRGGFTYGDE